MKTQTEIIKPVESRRPNSIEEIEDTMSEMDKVFRTSFKDWIRDESNLNYICTMKRPVFMREFRQDPKRGIKAIGWITSNWALTSIMEFLLKMFPQFNIDSNEFARLIFDFTLDWPLYKTNGKFTLLMRQNSSNYYLLVSQLLHVQDSYIALMAFREET